MEVQQDVQLSIQGMGGVQVVVVVAGPPEGLAGKPLKAGHVDVALPKQRQILLGKVLPHYANDLGIGKVTRRECEVGGRAAQCILYPAKRGFYRVQGDRAHYQQAHETTTCWVMGVGLWVLEEGPPTPITQHPTTKR